MTALPFALLAFLVLSATGAPWPLALGLPLVVVALSTDEQTSGAPP